MSRSMMREAARYTAASSNTDPRTKAAVNSAAIRATDV
jgi:hypothetical protein